MTEPTAIHNEGSPIQQKLFDDLNAATATIINSQPIQPTNLEVIGSLFVIMLQQAIDGATDE